MGISNDLQNHDLIDSISEGFRIRGSHANRILDSEFKSAGSKMAGWRTIKNNLKRAGSHIRRKSTTVYVAIGA